MGIGVVVEMSLVKRMVSVWIGEEGAKASSPQWVLKLLEIVHEGVELGDV